MENVVDAALKGSVTLIHPPHFHEPMTRFHGTLGHLVGSSGQLVELFKNLGHLQLHRQILGRQIKRLLHVDEVVQQRPPKEL